MRFILLGISSLCVVFSVACYCSPTSLTVDDLSSIVGAQSESTDCLDGGRNCPYDENPVGGSNTPCPDGVSDGQICTGTAAAEWCQDTTKGQTCQNTTYSWLNWDCVTDASSRCKGYERKCVDMLGTLVCAGRTESCNVNCGESPKCHY